MQGGADEKARPPTREPSVRVRSTGKRRGRQEGVKERTRSGMPRSAQRGECRCRYTESGR
ncbi:hypothetical protein PYCCODRAFT_707886 [Trametes coccinea BRFM310]|uniref:Uncharacterized protein n=1 Tax=Trametes coccinea (strain BRFM310) TaxID=1353009 RepID=A0A1Y2IG86_TRAC3|nr:hypothetical protein PYCCODRAFT_707886 [Trametes coccinea BRFM310]